MRSAGHWKRKLGTWNGAASDEERIGAAEDTR
jgi:hypothetical protein